MHTKRKYVCFAFLLFVTLCAASVFFVEGWQITDDLTFHANRFYDLTQNIKSGVFAPYMGTTMFFGQGYPVHTFYPYLWMYPFAVIAALGIPIETMFTVFYVLLRPLAVLSAYGIAGKIIPLFCFDKDRAYRLQVLFAVIYALDPYQWYNYFSRGAVGELLVGIWLPLVFGGFYLILKQKKYGNRFLIAGMVGICYSHCLSILLTTLVLLVLCTAKYKEIWKNKKILLNYLCCAGITAGLAMPYLAPMAKLLLSDTFLLGQNGIFYQPLENSVPIAFGVPIAISVSISLLALLYVTFFRRLIHRWMQFILWVALISTDLFPWCLINKIPLLNTIQFAHRLYAFISIVFGYLVIRSLSENKKCNRTTAMSIVALFLLVCIAVTATPLFNKCIARGKESGTEAMDINSIGAWDYLTTKSIHHFNKKTLNLSAHELPDPLNGATINDDACVSITEHTGNKYHVYYTINDAKISAVQLPVLFYEGYVVQDDTGNSLDVFCSPSGLLSVTPHNLQGRLLVVYSGSVTHIVAFCICGMTMLATILSIFWYKTKGV